MTILVTGAAGFVGNNVVRQLAAQGRAVRGLVRSSAAEREFAGVNCDRVTGDVTDPDSLHSAMDGVTAVIHAAAIVHIGWTRVEELRRVNVDGTRNMVRLARQANARLIYVSSVDALGLGSPTQPADEETPRVGNPPCGYVVTKQAAEQVVREALADGLDGVIVNPGFMLGPWDWKPTSARMILSVLGQKPLLSPPGGGCICDVRDVASGIIKALDQAPCGSQYILGGVNMRYHDLWSEIARHGGVRGPVLRAGPIMTQVVGWCGDLMGKARGRESDMNSAITSMACSYHYYSSDRARRELHYSSRPLATTLDDTCQWLREYGYLN
ncbi:MAG: NAD-dependent epimerase/dehydratase family protein [Planctomycetota bacterium]